MINKCYYELFMNKTVILTLIINEYDNYYKDINEKRFNFCNNVVSRSKFTLHLV